MSIALLSLCLAGPAPALDAAPSDAELVVPYYDVPHDDAQLHGPPSLPSAPAHLGSPLAMRGTPAAPEAAIASLLKYEYKWSAGFIGAGGDVEPPANATVEEALARCDALVRCRGITYAGNKSTSTAQRIYFKIGDGVETAAGWSAWVKLAGVTPPALTVAVGGTSRLELRLRQDFYTVQNLSRAGDVWSFTRPLDGASTLPMCAHLGDITLRLRQPAGKSEWSYFSSMALGAKATPLPLEVARRAADRAARAGGRRRGSAPRTGQLLAAQNITEMLSSSAPHAVLPLTAIRSYERSADGAALVLRFTLTSTSDAPIELGGIGMAMPESPGNPPAGIETVVWNDPHVGGEHGFVEFVRVVDDEATLLVTAADPKSTPLEAWRPMLEDAGKGDAYEWTVASKAWADEWATNRQYPFLNISDALKHAYPPFAIDPQTPWPSTDGQQAMPQLARPGVGAADPWNPPTSLTLPPRGSVTLALRLQLASGGPRTRDATLAAMGAPVIRAVPGYVLPTDLSHAMLFVKPPAGASVASVTAETPPGANVSLAFSHADADADAAPGSGYVGYAVKAAGYGRVRARIAFSDGTSATAHYFVLPPFAKQVAALGSHLADVAWLPREYPDPFGRGASVMPYDRSMCGNAPCGHVLNDARAYDAGLSDDAGGGNPLGFASKVRAAPTAHEASRVDEYIEWTLYGVKPDTASWPLKSLQIREDEVDESNAESVDGIRMTMFYYDKDLNNHTSGHFDWAYSEADKCHKPFGGPTWCMTENMANATYRGFNYPHQIASYWAMYHVARHTTLTTRLPWHWYLYRAGRTCLKLGQASVGFMDGTVAREVLEALLVEGAAGNATFAALGSTLEKNMKARQLHWAGTPYPYGSEFGFDTTGQEEVVVWNLYFGNETVARKTVDHVLSYMRNSPTWAYHGGARSWGDIGNNGKYLSTFGTGATDRGQMHYRSGLNMIPLIEFYRRHPEEGTYLLEIAMGAISGQMTNIDPATGATSMMFHAVPHMLAHDPHSGDYGLGFFGNALESGAYFVRDAELGALCFLCDLADGASAARDGAALIVPRDAYRIAVFLEPLGLYLTSQCGTIQSVELPAGTPNANSTLAVTFDAAAQCEYLRLKLTKTAKARPGSGFEVVGAQLVRGAYQITPSPHATTVAHVTYAQ